LFSAVIVFSAVILNFLFVHSAMGKIIIVLVTNCRTFRLTHSLSKSGWNRFLLPLPQTIPCIFIEKRA
jgi:hypothetical protein